MVVEPRHKQDGFDNLAVWAKLDAGGLPTAVPQGRGVAALAPGGVALAVTWDRQDVGSSMTFRNAASRVASPVCDCSSAAAPRNLMAPSCKTANESHSSSMSARECELKST